MYILFAGKFYYPKGGWDDMQFQSDEIMDCYKYLVGREFDWWHIVSSKSLEIVDRSQ